MKVLVILWTLLQIVVTEDNISDCGKLCSCEFESRESTDTIVTCKGEHINEIPKHLPRNTTDLYFSGTSIRVVPANAFVDFPEVSKIFFRDYGNSPCLLETLAPKCFDDMLHLKVIVIVRCHQLHTIASGVFGKFCKLNKLQIFHSGLTSVPNLESLETRNHEGFMDEIDFSNNKIEEIKEHAFMGVKTNSLRLDNNKLRKIHNGAFYKSQIVNLKLHKNPTLTELDEYAFEKIEKLEKLDLSHTSINKLPQKGLANIVHLRLKGTKTLRQFPSVLHFNKITTAELYYPHHCCMFKNPEKQNPTKWRADMEFQRRVQMECSVSNFGSTFSSTKPGLDETEVSTMTLTTSVEKRIKRHGSRFNDDTDNKLGFGQVADPQISNKSNTFEKPEEQSEFNDKFSVPINSTQTQTAFCGPVIKDYRQVICTPEPDAFNPCEDLMGYEWLRISVWIILLAAIFGNSVVLVVLIKSRSKMTVTKFLMCNLAFADLVMGIYLLLLASIDAHTLGEYFNYAVIWQNEGGCQAAGFLTVFSCELSIFTLTIITLERWYAISHAIHLTKRLRIRQAMVFMAFGWLYALFMAHLPLVGISNYGHVSICLPMKVEDAADVAYVVSILVVNGIGFICICGCYINMYCIVRTSHTNVRNNDTTIAKRMAMLVLTNFACWAPIAFFGLTASAGLPLIDITNSKILLVFFYPLNSFVNPYLYVIITKQFRKDLYILLGKYGICTERANRYRVTFTSTHSRNSLAVHNVHNSNRNGIKWKSSTSTICPPKFSRSPSNSESNCSTSTFLHTCSKQPSIRIRLPETKTLVDKLLKDYQEASSSERHLRSPPPYIRSASEYVVFFPPPRRDSYPKYKYQCTRQTSIETSLCSDTTEATYVSSTDENPWVLQQQVVLEGDEHSYAINAIDEEILEEFESTKLADVKAVTVASVTRDSCLYDNDGGSTSDDDCEDDSIQQTLLKHCTLRESPVASLDRKCPSDSLLSDHFRSYSDKNSIVICSSKSSPNIDEINVNCVLFE